MSLLETYSIGRPNGGSLLLRRRPGVGPSVVFVHGFCGSGDLYLRLFKLLDHTDLDLVTFDLSGHGGSSAPYDLASNAEPSWIEDLGTVVGSLQATSVVLVGWSMGAIGIAEYLMDSVELGPPLGINLVAPAFAVGNEKAKQRSGTEFITAVSGLLSSDADMQRSSLSLFAKSVVGDEDPVLTLAVAGAAALTNPDVRRSMIRHQSDVDSFYRSTSIPLLVSLGKNDAVIDPSITTSLLAGGAARLSLYEGTGHSPHLNSAPRFAAELESFIDSLIR